MIKVCKDSKYFLKICDKLDKVKKKKISKQNLYTYLVGSLLSDNTIAYVSEEDNEMNGCLVLTNRKDLTGRSIVLMLFIWIDPHYPKLIDKFVSLANERAKDTKADAVYFIVDKEREKLSDRKMGKYGFEREFSYYRKKAK